MERWQELLLSKEAYGTSIWKAIRRGGVGGLKNTLFSW